MSALRLRSVSQKMLLMVLVANFATLLVAGGALLYHDLLENRSTTAADLTALASILAQGSSTAMEFDDSKVATENLAQLRANPNIVAAAIYNTKGKLFTQYFRDQQQRSDIPIAPEKNGFQFSAGELAVFKQINTRSGVLGTVYIREGYQLSKWLRDYLIILGAVLLGSLALGMLISSRLQRWISRPILEVSRVAKRVMEQRDYHLRAIKSSEDEIGQLADAFNGMLHTLEHEIAERNEAELAVRTLNAELEQRVTDRTNDLRIANQTLVTRTEEAENANRAKADFLANMSHEIRTPMNGILGLAYLLDRRQLDAEAADMVKKIRNAGRSLQAIINDILDFSKIEAGKLDIEHEPFRLLDVFDNLAGIMAANAGDKDIELAIAPPPNINGHLLGDALRLEQVLINLVGNAIKFTDRGTVKLGISLLAKDEKIATMRFSVTDSGIGIPLDKQAHIFTAFSQADTSTTRRFGGTGLGLTICRHLVIKMGGEIGVISEPGKGSEFWFTVPFAWSAATDFVPPQLAQLDVLIADDSEVACEVMALTARSVGWIATKAESGEAALDMVRTKHRKNSAYDVMLVDWKMPGMDGLEVAAEIRQTLKDESFPVLLMVTSFSRDDLLKHPKIDIVDGVLTKPITSSMLYDGVANALKRRGHEFAGNLGTPAIRSGNRIPGVRVLVVDDSDINREVALRILKDDGAAFVHLENDGKAAVEWLTVNPQAVDIVLMDVQMPEMDGYEATRQIRATPQLANLQVVALTAGAFKAQQEAALQAGMNAFVAKPFNIDELMATIQKLIRCSPELMEKPRVEPVVSVDKRVSPMPGIAIAKGLEVWKDIAVYKRFLVKFSSDYADCCSRLTAFHIESDHVAMRALAHKVRGSAANLALLEIAQCAQEVEIVPVNASDLPEIISRLHSALNTAFSSIKLLSADAVTPAPAQQVPTNIVDITPVLAELLRALDTNSPIRANQLLKEFSTVLPQDSITALHSRIDDFDFRGAESVIHRLAAELGIDTTKFE
ncbi:MAG TPA: response regulator [Burkholderiaceae bacterium]|nr:response regulator [Burkholderiaceae bacterium]